MPKPMSILNGRRHGPSIDKLMAKYGTVGRGVLITYAEAAAELNMDAKSQLFLSIFREFREKFTGATGIGFRVEASVGVTTYATADQQLRDLPLRHMRRANRELVKAARHANIVPDAELSPQFVGIKATMLGSISGIAANNRQNVKEFSVRLGVTEALPKVRPV